MYNACTASDKCAGEASFYDIIKRYSSGAVWKSRWLSWAFCPHEPYGFCGSKAILNNAHALVSTCPSYVNRHPRTLSNTGRKNYKMEPICTNTPHLCWRKQRPVFWVLVSWPELPPLHQNSHQEFLHLRDDICNISLNCHATLQSFKPYCLRDDVWIVGINRPLSKVGNLIVSEMMYESLTPTIRCPNLETLLSQRWYVKHQNQPSTVPAPFLFSVHLHGITFLFLSARNLLWTHSNVTKKTLLFPKL